MASGFARVDLPDTAEARPLDQLPRARQDVHQRLGRLPDGHPSSPRYSTQDLARQPEDRRSDVSASGWGAPDVQGHPDRPDPADIRLPADRARHILAGDGPDSPGGGHRHGAERPGKTEFPARWSDDMIVATVRDVAGDPEQARWQGFNGRWQVSGERDGVGVTAVVLPDGRIWTAWPEPGGAGVTRNRGA